MAATQRKKHFGLVCQTHSDECRFRTITRTRFLAMDANRQREVLGELYADNIARLTRTIQFCADRDIRLFRMASGLFPMSDERPGRSILKSLGDALRNAGDLARRESIRVVMHPDQFVVLNSESPNVRRASKIILEKHALAMDLMGLPQSPWAAMILHGGKSGRGKELIEIIQKLPAGIRDRICLENDEYSYGAADIFDICKSAGVPMIFDNHHHAIKEKIENYDDASFAKFTKLARKTWPTADWQIVHLSNGRATFLDRNHSDLILEVPKAFDRVRWIEVEAKGKENAIAQLRG